ncbi:MAG: hypothetical protein PHE51_04675 [Eubacteriales bacterium]|nr:hypothetical protein [Eubacteriales bacterium]
MNKKEMDIIRNWLKGYRLSLKELNARTEHVEWLKSEIFTPLSQSEKERDKYASIRVEKIMADILRDAEIRLVNLRYEIETIESEIQELDEYERCVLYNRYILGIQWLDLPERIGYEIAQCQRLERRALENLASSQRIKQLLNSNSSTHCDKPIDNLALSKCATIF